MPNATALFLAEGDIAAARVLLSSVHGLWGGHEVAVSAGGDIRVTLVDRARRATHHDLGPDPAACAAIFAALIDHDMVALARAPAEPRAYLVPDTAITTIALANGSGRAESLWFGEHDRLAPGPAAIRDALLALVRRAG